MSSKIDDLLKQKMSIDEFESTQSIPQLNPDILKLIADRKKKKKTSSISKIINFFFIRYKATSIGFAMVAIVITINFVCTLNIEKRSVNRTSVGRDTDTTLTVASNTYLATLNQFSTAAELPANTSTALSCISTFVARN